MLIFLQVSSIWEMYCEFAMQVEKNPSAIRQVFEQALTAIGLHIRGASPIWTLYRAYELKTPPKETLADRVRSLYHRQLAMPQMSL